MSNSLASQTTDVKRGTPWTNIAIMLSMEGGILPSLLAMRIQTLNGTLGSCFGLQASKDGKLICCKYGRSGLCGEKKNPQE